MNIQIDLWLSNLIEEIADDLLRERVKDEYYNYVLEKKPTWSSRYFEYRRVLGSDRVKISLADVLKKVMEPEVIE
jgi:hypothetical protein